MDSFYNEQELKEIGFKALGKNVLVSKKASIYSPDKITLGNNVRIDDFCILSGVISVGDYVHISAHTCVFAGEAGVEIGNFSGLSSRCAVYAISDDYSGSYLANAMVPDEFRNIVSRKVVIGNCVVIGTGTTILPGVKIADGAAVGCMSLINKTIDIDGIYCGIPVKRIKDRRQDYKKQAELIKNGNK